MNYISQSTIEEFLKLKNDKSLYHRESKVLEFKEQFNLAGLAEYFKDFAAFSNNAGGYIIFGISNSPRELVGLSDNSAAQFEKIDPEKISGFLLEIFAPDIQWDQQLFGVSGKKFGVFYIHESKQKPVIAEKDEGRDQTIKNGDIFFRYAGRTQRIEFAELSYIIDERIKSTNEQWLSLMSKIAKAGPANAAILDTEKGLIQRNDEQILVIDEGLVDKLKFIKEGQFKEEEGAVTLRLVGDVKPMGAIKVTRTIQRSLTDQYSFSAKELVTEIKKTLPQTKEKDIYTIIKDNKLKNDVRYSAYNFRNKTQEDKSRESGRIPSGIPSLYNQQTVGFIVKVLQNK
jgi:hypothetical protein